MAPAYNPPMRLTMFLFFAAMLTAGCDRPTDAVSTPRPLITRPAMQDKVVKSEAEWRTILSPAQYEVLRRKGTERPFTGQYTDLFEPGTYYCAACGAELFQSDHKFHSGCGWPSFYTAAAGDRVRFVEDRSHGMVRTEVLCARCDSHLGHVFEDAPDQPTGLRYCINSVCLRFVPGPTTRPAEK